MNTFARCCPLIKLGTESAGAFEDIVVQNCTVFDTRCEGLAVLTVDGARIERVSFSNIVLRNIKGDAILVRLGARNRTYRKEAVAKQGSLKDVMFSQIQGTRISNLGNSITGIPGQPVENLVLRDINLEFTGGGTAEDAGRRTTEKRTPLWAFEQLHTFRAGLIQRAGRLTRPHGKLTLTISAGSWIKDRILTVLKQLRNAA